MSCPQVVAKCNFFRYSLVSALPLMSSLFLCLLVSYFNDWPSVISTHCKNWQFFPSISSVIGDHTPQRYIWRMGVGMSMGQRLSDVFLYWSFYGKANGPLPHTIVNALCFLSGMVENGALITLTYVSSTENYKVHEGAFIVFAIAAFFHQLLTILAQHVIRKPFIQPLEEYAYHWRITWFLANQVVFAFAVYVFLRHNWYCEPGVYSLFALCEWFTVISNIAFHFGQCWDTAGCVVYVGPDPMARKSQ